MKRGAAVKARPVLVIDDDPILCALVDLALSGAGFEVLTALDGLSGIEIARAARPAVILLRRVSFLAPSHDCAKNKYSYT